MRHPPHILITPLFNLYVFCFYLAYEQGTEISLANASWMLSEIGLATEPSNIGSHRATIVSFSNSRACSFE